MQLFYSPTISEADSALSPDESRHCCNVLRKKAGDEIKIVDGKGGLYTALLSEVKQKRCVFEIVQKESLSKNRKYYLHVLIGPTKNISRTEWFLEKATELGIDEISFVKSFHSERKVVKPVRLERILVGAMKQSLKAHLPKLNDIRPFDKVISENYLGAKYIAYVPEKGNNFFKLAKTVERINILIGPEGGYSEAEIDKARASNWQVVGLGPHRLRTETAAFTAVHGLSLRTLFS